MDKIYKKLKKQKGEKFAQVLRNHHNGLLEIPDLDKIVKHAGRDAEPLLPYLMSLLAENDDKTPETEPGCPFELLDKAGYDAFHADTLELQNSITPYFKQNERLCTFNDHARYQNYYMVHAVKKNVDSILRSAFNGKEKRQDEYGTSVISIQIHKNGGFISIKNRYNHTVSGCDHTFKSNPDNIIQGLSAALKNHFNVDFSTNASQLPEGFIEMKNQIFQYHTESNGFYYGDQAWAKDGQIHTANKSAGDAMFDGFIFDNKTKTLKKIDDDDKDSFADDFNRTYGGNKDLHVKDGNLMLGDDIIIGAENSRIKTLYLPGFTTMGDFCLGFADALTSFSAPHLTTMSDYCLYSVKALTSFSAPHLTNMGGNCLRFTDALTHFNVKARKTNKPDKMAGIKTRAMIRRVKAMF